MVLLLSCTGCVEKVEQEETNQQYIESQPPVVNITTQGTLSLIPSFLTEETINAVAYAGDTITFDASHSTDDGAITSYEWIVEYPDVIKQGMTITHVYIPSFSDTPLYVVEIVLTVVDDNGLTSSTTYHLGIIQKSLTLYFDTHSLLTEKPAASSVGLQPTLGRLRDSPTLTFDLSSSISLPPNNWACSLELSKTRLSIIRSITMKFLDAEGSVIDMKSEHFSWFEPWTEKIIIFEGRMSESQQLQLVSLEIVGFSIRSPIRIRCGGDQASMIEFHFDYE